MTKRQRKKFARMIYLSGDKFLREMYLTGDDTTRQIMEIVLFLEDSEIDELMKFVRYLQSKSAPIPLERGMCDNSQSMNALNIIG